MGGGEDDWGGREGIDSRTVSRVGAEEDEGAAAEGGGGGEEGFSPRDLLASRAFRAARSVPGFFGVLKA